MDSAGYVTLTRQTGLMREMQTIAQNIANQSTTGYRREGIVFAEHVRDLGADHGALSMAHANARHIDLDQGPLTQTGGRFDLAIEGDGFFLIDTPSGQALTRAGVFTPDSAGELVTPDGHKLLDAGGAPVFVPADAADIAIANDGTLSVDGAALGQIGLYSPTEPGALNRMQGTLFLFDGDLEPTQGGAILQGFVEGSNADPVSEIARMIEVQHAYQLGQSFLDREDDRVRAFLRAMGQ